MPPIKILPLHEAQKIAAGEVVERPANVVKELLENALDAGATQITLYIGAGGKQLIRILDNGTGMSQEDARLSILPHATSKISSVDELSSLVTFGFRGEALATIASVSRMQLVTKQADLPEGTKLTIDAGTINKEETVAANSGTDITIEDLFFNVPARKKFLKTEKTEWHAIQQLVYAYALDYPAVHYTLYHNQQLLLSCAPCTTLEARAQQIFDQTITERLVALAPEHGTDITIEGVISDHQYGRYDRSHIYLFVNKRWVKNHKLATAIIKGYQGVLQQGHYPCAIVSITVPPHTVDINIHPRKEEVQFLHPRMVEDLLYSCVKKRLETHIAQRLQFSKTSTIPYQPYNNFPTQHAFTPPASSQPYTQAQKANPFAFPADAFTPLTEEFPPAATPVREEQTTTWQEPSYTIKGQFALTYIMLETAEGLLLIDQHAAHERILYEQIGQKMQQQEVIHLLFPETIRLSAPDYTYIAEHLPTLQQFGIEAELWSEQSLIITAAPVYVKPHMLKDIITALIAAIADESSAVQETAHKKIMHAVQAMIACKAAVKANDLLQPEEMHSLIRQLYTLKERLTCPHGRPTSWLLSLPEIERKFKRIL